MEAFNFVIEGRGLDPALMEMERSERVRVLGPHISTYYPGSGADGRRMVVSVEAASIEDGRDFLWGFLQGKGRYAVDVDRTSFERR